MKCQSKPWSEFWHTPQKRQSLFLFVLLLLFGVIVTNHVTMVNKTKEQTNLADLYKTRQEELDVALAQYESLTAENARLLKLKEAAIAKVLSQEGQPELMDELKRMQVLAGLTDVTGPGLIVTLNDKPGLMSSAIRQMPLSMTAMSAMFSNCSNLPERQPFRSTTRGLPMPPTSFASARQSCATCSA